MWHAAIVGWPFHVSAGLANAINFSQVTINTPKQKAHSKVSQRQGVRRERKNSSMAGTDDARTDQTLTAISS